MTATPPSSAAVRGKDDRDSAGASSEVVFIARFSQIPPSVSRAGLERPAGIEPLVDIRCTAALVGPRVSDHATFVDQERRALCDVLEPPEGEGDVEAADGLAVPVR